MMGLLQITGTHPDPVFNGHSIFKHIIVLFQAEAHCTYVGCPDGMHRWGIVTFSSDPLLVQLLYTFIYIVSGQYKLEHGPLSMCD